ncbi:MAG: dephospho-CoA kinase [Acidobacteria bacterium 13_1_20CM_3_53_8]|nr:MAG: dephospho-CoA kinase [Acidobacteria bacterium 13_1_20CM_3_53_8]
MRVGLTGSIAVGKSFVADTLLELGCHVLDADETAREVVAPGSEGLKRIFGEFGSDVIREDGTLDRGKLGAIVFGDEEKRLKLNSILHPLVIAAQDEQLRRWEVKDPHGIAVVDAALMIESGGYKRFDKMIVVHCRPEVQLQRLTTRNNLTPEEARRRIAAQMPQEEKMRYADFLIDTSEGFEDAKLQTEKVFERLLELSENFSRKSL